MKKLIYAGVVVAAFLVGCTTAPPPAQSNNEPVIKIHEISKKLVDGRTAVCLYTESFVVGGYSNVRSSVFDIDCDFPPRKK